MNFDDILDKSIDDLKDLPSFKVPDTGIYKLSVLLEPKEINDKPAVIARLEVRELVELADSTIPETDHAKAGDKFDVAFILTDNDGNDNELGWGRLKEFLKPFEQHFGEKSLKVLITQKLNAPMDITAKIIKKARKDDKEKFDARISDITVD